MRRRQRRKYRAPKTSSSNEVYTFSLTQIFPWSVYFLFPFYLSRFSLSDFVSLFVFVLFSMFFGWRCAGAHVCMRSRFAEGKSDKEILDHLVKNSRYDKRLLPPVDGKWNCIKHVVEVTNTFWWWMLTKQWKRGLWLSRLASKWRKIWRNRKFNNKDNKRWSKSQHAPNEMRNTGEMCMVWSRQYFFFGRRKFNENINDAKHFLLSRIKWSLIVCMCKST